MQAQEFKLFLIAIHSINVDRMSHYNVAFLCEGGMDQVSSIKSVLEDKTIPNGVQELYWNNTKNIPLQYSTTILSFCHVHIFNPIIVT
jgi:hypothetical protein